MSPHEEEVNPVLLGARLHGLADGIADYLDATVARHGEWPARSFYGESFAALLLGPMGPKYAASVERLRVLYQDKDKQAADFHWEFNNYAWYSLFRKTGDPVARSFVLPLRFRHTPVTNWTLLRSVTRFLVGQETEVAGREAVNVLERFQSGSGLICDDRSVRSFQYHCFSAVMTAELETLSGSSYLLDSFRRAADFIERFVLRTGDTLYLGRGQQQSFGYGALACLLALSFRRFREARYLGALARCLSFLDAYRRMDGSFPMVLNGCEQGFPAAGSVSDARFPGWYAYNNYFDYLPFLGVFLRKAACELDGLPGVGVKVPEPGAAYRDRDFRVVRKANYEAVVARPGGGWRGNDGFWTNDLPFPYVVRKGVRLTPSFGGEQYGSPLYTPAGVPLPGRYGKSGCDLMRGSRLWSFFWGKRLVVVSRAGLLIRRFRFLENEIVVEDFQWGFRKLSARYAFDQVKRVDDRTIMIRGGATVTFSEPMHVEDTQAHYWGGPLCLMRTASPSWRCVVRVCVAEGKP